MTDSPEHQAWLTAFFIENHLDYYTYPDHAATDEQVRFMVYIDDEERYFPCSDKMFRSIMTRSRSAFLQKRYHEALQRVLGLISDQIEDPQEKAFLESLIFTKFKHETRDELMIPSRVEKRLLSIFLNRTRIEDPCMAEKAIRNRRADHVLSSAAFTDALNHVTRQDMEKAPESLLDIKKQIAAIEFKRLVAAAGDKRLWMSDEPAGWSKKDFLALFSRPVEGDGWQKLLSFLGFTADGSVKSRKILWLADESGQVVMDLALVRFLSGLGHKVIVAFKVGPFFTKADICDLNTDPTLMSICGQLQRIDDPNLTKNDLVKTLRSDTPVLALSDGTNEDLNLLLASTTFARVFKEVDAVISRGAVQRRRFFETHFQFTQDIYSMVTGKDGVVSVLFKSRHPAVIKFSHEDLENKAQQIVDKMKAAKSEGMTVIFYSGIIGSIPGKIQMAKQIMSVFVDHLKKQSTMTFIINPSEHYEPGMDADDLMFMWEIVQRSGYIDIWRFQSNDDIATAFALMNKKIPPEWVGKDATYSTGCTKEMRIALDVQQLHPEMQIIGPTPEKFMRRADYGVGSMFDQRLAHQ